MKRSLFFCWLSLAALAVTASAQTNIDPQVRTKATADSKITVVEVAPHFVTTIRAPEPVNAVVVGDPALFQVEHSEHEPELVFVKALTTETAQSNLLISTNKGRQISFVLVSHGKGSSPAKVDFLLRYRTPGGFLVEPDAIPTALVPQTAAMSKVAGSADSLPAPLPALLTPTASPQAAPNSAKTDSLDDLLQRQKQAPLPVLYGARIEGEDTKGERLRTGISEVLDGGQQVIVLFSVVNTSKQAILLMPPQIQLGGKEKTGKVVKHEHWSTAEQLPVVDFRLSRRRIGPGERADGVVLFERPPYKRSTETLFLQMAESGAVDKPALAPIGFGVSTLREAANHVQ
jgi:hypothetical protein